jgi:hypothetical protein
MASNDSAFMKEIIRTTIKDNKMKITQDNLDGLVVTVSAFVRQIVQTNTFNSIGAEDLMTPIWIGVNEGCKEIKKHHIPIDSGFIFTCVKNKILDVVRRMGTAANRTLSYAVRNRTYCAVLKPEGDPEDTFDYQTTKTLSQREEEMCQWKIVRLCMDEQWQQIRSERDRQIVAAWYEGDSYADIVEKLHISSRNVARVLQTFKEGTKRRILDFYTSIEKRKKN